MTISLERNPEITPTPTNDSSMDGAVQVAVRIRPMLPFETGSTKCVEVLRTSPSKRKLKSRAIRIGGEDGPCFTFDEALGDKRNQRDVYRACVSPLVEACLNGYNATVLAYGQTGSGKTHTILGPSVSQRDERSESHHVDCLEQGSSDGVIPRSLRDLFAQLEERKASHASDTKHPAFEYEVRVQFLELYGEEIRDLLSPHGARQKLTIRDGVRGNVEPEVVGATEMAVTSSEEALLCLHRGLLRRVTGATAMNAESSRSHAIMSVIIEQTTTTVVNMEPDDDPGDDDYPPQMEVEVKRSKFHFVDLAGSERQKKSLAEGKRLREGIEINKGLLVLGNVISALGDPKKRGKTFVPYRDSKLTRLLKGSLGGNHKTLMIACISPSSLHMEESLNCLRYANRAKNIRNDAKMNVDATGCNSKLVNELRSQVRALAGELLKVRDVCAKEHIELDDGVFSPIVLKRLSSGEAGSSSQPPPVIDPLSATTPKMSGNNLFAVKSEKEPIIELSKDFSKDFPKDSPKDLPNDLPKELLSANSTSSGQDLKEMQNQLSETKETLSRMRTWLRRTNELMDHIDEEEEQEEKELSAITNKYAPDSDISFQDDEDEEMHEHDEDKISAEDARPPTPNLEEEGEEEGEEKEDEFFRRRQEHLDAQLSELSKDITAKEELIEQLKLCEEKYELMRDFYEEKLHQLEAQVEGKEKEKEVLEKELAQLKMSNDENRSSDDESSIVTLQKSIQEKEQSISELRKKRSELASLTKVSAQNKDVIHRLEQDLVSMKRAKVSLERQISSERKEHECQVQKLKRDAMRKEKEVVKWKQELTKNTIARENAQRMAKTRLNEMGAWRSKYKQAEKKLRMQAVKLGVIERAGLNAVMLGKRGSKPDVSHCYMTSSSSPVSEESLQNIRKYLDEKIADVGRKEAIAEKLAIEMEGHLELCARKEQLVKAMEVNKTTNRKNEKLMEDLDAVCVQIQYKERRIRQLTGRLSKKPFSQFRESPEEKDAEVDAEKKFILDEKELVHICPEIDSTTATQIVATVLFGMVVRERRRVASLARTACSLDQKAEEAEKLVSSMDKAIRSNLEEQRVERVSLAQSQQEQILSLMELVSRPPSPSDENEGNSMNENVNGVNVQESVTNSATKDNPTDTKVGEQNEGTTLPKSMSCSSFDNVMLRLANERIAALETQLLELENDRSTLEAYKVREEKTSETLDRKEKECTNLKGEIVNLRSLLRQIRDLLKPSEADQNGTKKPLEDGVGNDTVKDESSKTNDIGPSISSNREIEYIMGLIENSLRLTKLGSKRTKSSNSMNANSFNNHFDSHETLASSSSDSGSEPEWASEIMADLELIARGQTPPSLSKNNITKPVTPSHCEFHGRRPCSRGGDESDASSVFDRLTNPDNFTGIQKHSFMTVQKRNERNSREKGDRRNKVTMKPSFSANG